MEKIVLELDVDGKSGISEVNKLNKALNETTKKGVKGTKELSKEVEGVGDAGKKGKKGVGALSTGFKGLGTAMKAAGIGLVIASFVALKEIFSQNQRIVDAFTTGFETFSIVANQVVDVFIDMYDSVAKNAESFDALGKVASGLLTVALSPLKVAFYGVKLGIEQAMLAWEQSFLGDNDPKEIKRLRIQILGTKNDLLEVAIAAKDASVDVVSNFGEAIGEFAEVTKTVVKGISEVSIKSAYEIAQTTVQLKKSAEVAAVAQQGLVEVNDRLAEKQRQIRDDDRKSISERKKANDELLIILRNQETEMIKLADLQIAAAQSDFDKNGNQENYLALLEAQNNKLGVQAQIEGFISEQKVNDAALDREGIALTNSKLESESNLSIERKRFNAELIDDELLRLERLREIDELEAEQESARLEAIVLNANAGTQAKIDAQINLDAFTEESRQTNLSRNQEISKAEAELAGKKIKEKRMVVDAIGQFADAESGIGKALLIVKQGLALQETIMDLKRITFKGVEATGDALVSTSQNVANSSKIGFPWNLITIASAIAQGVGIIKSVKGAVSKTKAKAGSAGSSVPSIPTPSMPSQSSLASSLPPAFNVVGQSDTSQLADSIGSQSKSPQRAYVVSGDVTTSQEMERNIVEGASI